MDKGDGAGLERRIVQLSALDLSTECPLCAKHGSVTSGCHSESDRIGFPSDLCAVRK